MRFLRQLRAWYDQVAPGAGLWLPRFGLLLLAISSGFAVHSWLFARTQQRSTATITENVSTFGPQGSVIYLPRLRFLTPSGEIVQVLAPTGIDEVEFAAGETVPVLYPPGKPQAAIIATTWRAYRAAIIFGLIGILIFDVGLIVRRLRLIEIHNAEVSRQLSS
jgi:hypothetical protein